MATAFALPSRRPWRTAAVVFGAAGGVLALTLVIAALSKHPLAYLTREPGAAVWLNPRSGHDCAYAGLLSLAGYAVIGLGVGVWLRRTLAEGPWGFLLAAVGLFGVSGAFDELAPGHHAFEDGSKFLGIVAWSTFFVSLAVAGLRPAGSGTSMVSTSTSSQPRSRKEA